jgi:hypothetical protein
MALFPIFGTAVALAGGDKLAGDRAYAGMFHHLGWSRGDMRAIAATELAGGLLMVPRPTRHLGAALVSLASATVFLSEVRHGDHRLATSRGLVMMLALAAWLTPRPRRVRR